MNEEKIVTISGEWFEELIEESGEKDYLLEKEVFHLAADLLREGYAKEQAVSTAVWCRKEVRRRLEEGDNTIKSSE